MDHHRVRAHCIIPPYMLRNMSESQNPQVRSAAMAALATTTRLRSERELVSPIRSALPSMRGQRQQRSVHDAHRHKLSPAQLPGPLARGEGGPKSADEAVNEAYEGLGATYAFYKEVFKRSSIDDRELPLIATVHYGNKYNNAVWNGQQMIFGDGDGVLFQGFTKSLDVIAHELTHGVTQHTSDLEYHNQSGALNESFSDVFGTMVKQFTKRQTVEQGDWLIGVELLAPGVEGIALRSLQKPGSAYDDPHLGKDPQPATMDGYVDLPDDEDNDWGGVHINSGIPNHAFYQVATALGGNSWERAGAIWYATLQRLSKTASFRECAQASAQVAGALYGTNSKEQDAVQEAWTKVGVVIAASQPTIAFVRGPATEPLDGSAAALRRQLQQTAEQIQRMITALDANR